MSIHNSSESTPRKGGRAERYFGKVGKVIGVAAAMGVSFVVGVEVGTPSLSQAWDEEVLKIKKEEDRFRKVIDAIASASSTEEAMRKVVEIYRKELLTP
jgi:hypothetical protein